MIYDSYYVIDHLHYDVNSIRDHGVIDNFALYLADVLMRSPLEECSLPQLIVPTDPHYLKEHLPVDPVTLDQLHHSQGEMLALE